LIQSLGVPLPGVHLRTLKAAYAEFSRSQDLTKLLEILRALPRSETAVGRPEAPELKREDLHLICFDHICS
jgi:hypothetical protein